MNSPTHPLFPICRTPFPPYLRNEFSFRVLANEIGVLESAFERCAEATPTPPPYPPPTPPSLPLPTPPRYPSLPPLATPSYHPPYSAPYLRQQGEPHLRQQVERMREVAARAVEGMELAREERCEKKNRKTEKKRKAARAVEGMELAREER